MDKFSGFRGHDRCADLHAYTCIQRPDSRIILITLSVLSALRFCSPCCFRLKAFANCFWIASLSSKTMTLAKRALWQSAQQHSSFASAATWLGPLHFQKIFGQDPHNVYINAFASYGWLGGISYFLLMHQHDHDWLQDSADADTVAELGHRGVLPPRGDHLPGCAN